MIIDNNNYFMKIGGRPNDSTAWGFLYAHTTQAYGSTIDLGVTANRSIAEGGYVVFRIGAAFSQASGSSEWIVACSAAATMGTDTVLWSSGTVAFGTLAALTLNSIAWVVKLPRKLPLRYLGVGWYPTTAAFTTGTMDIFISPNAPLGFEGAVP
jgi:hypothetical protein